MIKALNAYDSIKVKTEETPIVEQIFRKYLEWPSTNSISCAL